MQRMRRLRQVPKKAARRRGVSLTELLCVLGILSLLSSLYLSAVLKAYLRIMTFIESIQN